MGISKQPPKPFPITKGLPCQLKWTHSTIYLTDGVSASCHRVAGDPLEIKNGELNFHNPITEKIYQTIKPSPGRCIIWPSNFMYPHEVRETTKGTRYSFVSWDF